MEIYVYSCTHLHHKPLQIYWSEVYFEQVVLNHYCSQQCFQWLICNQVIQSVYVYLTGKLEPKLPQLPVACSRLPLWSGAGTMHASNALQTRRGHSSARRTQSCSITEHIFWKLVLKWQKLWKSSHFKQQQRGTSVHRSQSFLCWLVSSMNCVTSSQIVWERKLYNMMNNLIYQN
jgi:hypothetical protein